MPPSSEVPATRWWAPGRVNLVGDHTDYSGGLVLPLAIQLGTTVSVTVRADRRMTAVSEQVESPAHLVALDDLSPGGGGWAGYVEGAAWVLAREGVTLPGVDVHVDGDLPLGAGLASSASLVCAVVRALLDVVGESWDPQRVARAAQRVENEYVGAPVGVMDPMVVIHARSQHAMLLDTRTLEWEHVPLPLGTPLPPPSADAGLSGVARPYARATPDNPPGGWALVVVDTGAAHSTAGGGYAQRVAQCRDAAQALGVPELRDVVDPTDVDRLDDAVLRRRARHVVSENQRVLRAAELLRQGQVRDLGPLLLASHASLRDDFEVSTPVLDVVVEAATAMGAQGARVTGAGFGGSALVLAEAAHVEQATAGVRDALLAAGHAAPTVRRVRPVAGARPIVPGPQPPEEADSGHAREPGTDRP